MDRSEPSSGTLMIATKAQRQAGVVCSAMLLAGLACVAGPHGRSVALESCTGACPAALLWSTSTIVQGIRGRACLMFSYKWVFRDTGLKDTPFARVRSRLLSIASMLQWVRQPVELPMSPDWTGPLDESNLLCVTSRIPCQNSCCCLCNGTPYTPAVSRFACKCESTT